MLINCKGINSVKNDLIDFKKLNIGLKIAAVFSLAVPVVSFSQQATDLGTVGSSVSGSATGNTNPAPVASKAAAVAPTQSSLEVTQPKSIINRSFFDEARSPASDFSTLTAIAPSVTLGVSANGPGLSETKNGIRGFKDGEFNVTFDGIPFGDTNGPTHHSTAYFPASVIGRIEVDRGPGNASNLGQATFGGSINMFSRELGTERNFSTMISRGSWNTLLYGARFDSGPVMQLGDALLAVNYQKLTSDGFRTNSAVQGENFMIKFQKPISTSTLLTVNMNHNENWYYLNDKETGLTTAQAATYGKNYALGTNTLMANYYGYNYVEKSTNMNYVRIQSEFSNGWAIDNSSYYYNYSNNGLSAKATSLTAGLSSVVNSSGTTVSNQMDGYTKTNQYGVFGNIFKSTKQSDLGLLRLGLWAEKADTHRSQFEYNLLNGVSGNTAWNPNYNQAAVSGTNLTSINNTVYDQNSGWKQYQPFAEFEWKATDKLKITPGLKYMHTVLEIDAVVNQTARVSQNLSRTFTATLPFLTANYALSPTASLYAQYAKGMLVPDISSYQSSNATASNVNPQKSTNYQLGFVVKADRMTYDADVYYIDFTNKIATVPGTSSSQPVYYNQGGVTYKGVEGQATYAATNSFSLYANGSLNRAESTTTGLQISGVPNYTYAAGILYKAGGWSASLIQKRIGRSWVIDDQLYRMSSYGTTDLTASYEIKNPGMSFKSAKWQIGIYNIADRQDIISIKAANTNGTSSASDTFLWQPPRNAAITFRADY